MPPPPPPPPPPVPPPQPSLTTGPSKPPPGGKSRSALLSDISGGARLKKTVTNDRSTPLVGAPKKAPLSQNEGSGCSNPTMGGGGGGSLGGLFAGGMPKLRAAGDRKQHAGAGGAAILPPGMKGTRQTNLNAAQAARPSAPINSNQHPVQRPKISSQQLGSGQKHHPVMEVKPSPPRRTSSAENHNDTDKIQSKTNFHGNRPNINSMRPPPPPVRAGPPIQASQARCELPPPPPERSLPPPPPARESSVSSGSSSAFGIMPPPPSNVASSLSKSLSKPDVRPSTGNFSPAVAHLQSNNTIDKSKGALPPPPSGSHANAPPPPSRGVARLASNSAPPPPSRSNLPPPPPLNNTTSSGSGSGSSLTSMQRNGTMAPPPRFSNTFLDKDMPPPPPPSRNSVASLKQAQAHRTKDQFLSQAPPRPLQNPRGNDRDLPPPPRDPSMVSSDRFSLPPPPDDIIGDIPDFESRFSFKVDFPSPEQYRDTPKTYPSRNPRATIKRQGPSRDAPPPPARGAPPPPPPPSARR